MRSIACFRAIFVTVAFSLCAILFAYQASVSANAQNDAGRTAETSPRIAKARPFTADDRVAALESVHIALTEVGDGARYVWRRQHGRLAGVIQPTESFLDAKGRVCRHIIVLLNSGTKSKKTEAVACRLENGVWRFDS